MKLFKYILASVVVGLVGPAMADDLAPATANQWAGAYLGVSGGYGVADRSGCGDFGVDILGFPIIGGPDPIDTCDGAPVDLTFDYGQEGGLAGVQAGYNWTPSENFLIGVEFTASSTDMSGFLDNNAFSGEGQWGSLVTAAAKAGVTADRFMVYAEGGYAMASAKYTGDLGCEFDVTHTGPLAGGGVAMKVSDNVSIDLKYNHIWLDAQQSACTAYLFDGNQDLVAFPTQVRSQAQMDIVKLGVNFQFGN